MKKNALFFAVCCLFGSLCQAEISGGEYVHFPDKRPSIGIFPHMNGLAVGDVAYDAEFCSNDIAYVCFEAKEIKFAVPKILRDLNSWSYKNEKYKILQSLKMKGDHPAWVIEKTTGMKMWFVWSSFNGLLMFGVGDNKNQRGAYMLDGFCGFAADTACKELLKR